VNLDERLFRNFFFGEKLCHKLALVSLKLNNIAVLRIFDDAAVAVKLLFAFLKNDLLVDLRIDTLKPFKKQATRVNVSSVTSYTSRECKTKQNKTKRNETRQSTHLHGGPILPPVTLLHANVNVVVLNRIGGFLLLLFLGFVVVAKVKSFVCKRIVRCSRRRRRVRTNPSSVARTRKYKTIRVVHFSARASFATRKPGVTSVERDRIVSFRIHSFEDLSAPTRSPRDAPKTRSSAIYLSKRKGVSCVRAFEAVGGLSVRT
jgi:hypothetical protein